MMRRVQSPTREAIFRRLVLWLSVGLLSTVLSAWGVAAHGVRLDPREVVTLLPKDTVPAILDPTPFLVPADMARGVRDSDQVLGVVIGEESRAYPIAFLSWHEIVNDTVSGVPIVATWSPLCFSGIVYAREHRGQIFTFGASGKLWANGLLMYDHQTDSLWSQLTGQAITGPVQGTALQMLAATQTSWGTWKRLHRGTLVLDPSKSPYQRDYNADPYEGYYASEDAGVIAPQRLDQRLPRKALIVGLRLDGQVKAYPLTRLRTQPVVNDTIAQTAVVVAFHERAATGVVFNRRVGDRELTFAPAVSDVGEPLTMRDAQTGSLWSRLDGRAIEGPLRGERLAQVPSTYAFWFAWKDYYPDSAIYGEDARPEAGR
jgi:uncharacterized protein DUF3179